MLLGWLRGIGLFLSGMIVGSALFNAAMHHNFETLVQRNNALESELRTLKQDLEQEKSSKNKQSLISRIIVHIQAADGSEPLDPTVAAALRERIRSDLKAAIGKPAGLPDLYERLIQDEYHNIHEKDYRIRVQYISIVYSEMQVWVTARPFVRTVP